MVIFPSLPIKNGGSFHSYDSFRVGVLTSRRLTIIQTPVLSLCHVGNADERRQDGNTSPGIWCENFGKQHLNPPVDHHLLIWGWVKTLVPLVNIKIAGKWMFIPLKMLLIGIDPYPYLLY